MILLGYENLEINNQQYSEISLLTCWLEVGIKTVLQPKSKENVYEYLSLLPTI